MSGLLALLVAAEAVGAAQDSGGFRRRLVFTAVAGDVWGNMGTRRLLWDLHRGSSATAGLHLSDIDQVISPIDLNSAALKGSQADKGWLHPDVHKCNQSVEVMKTRLSTVDTAAEVHECRNR